MIIGYVNLPPFSKIKLSIKSKLLISKDLFLNNINDQSKSIVESIKEHTNTKNENYSSFRVENIEFFIPSLSVKIDQENEKKKIKIELDYSIGFLIQLKKNYLIKNSYQMPLKK